MGTDNDSISSLYHQADKPAPPQALDDAILAASRSAVTPASRSRGPFSGDWRVGTAVAAVIAITIILVPVLKQDQPGDALRDPEEQTPGRTELLEEAAPSASESTAVRKKTGDIPAPVRAPGMLLPNRALVADHAVPPTTAGGYDAASESGTEDASYPEKEEAQPRPTAIRSNGSGMQAADSAPFAVYTPEMWEVKISQLIDQDALEQARAELKQLESHYPTYSISPSILDQLK